MAEEKQSMRPHRNLGGLWDQEDTRGSWRVSGVKKTLRDLGGLWGQEDTRGSWKAMG